MSLLEQWASQETGRHTADSLGEDAVERGAFGDFDDDGLAAPASPSAGGEAPIFSLETVERSVARGRGQVTAVAAANNIIALVTSRGWLLRYDLAQSSSPVTEVELGKAPELRATGLWADPTGSHYVIAAASPAGWEASYMHARWKRPKPMTKLKGIHVTAAAWNPETVTPAATGEVALGTDRGTLMAVSHGEKEGKERGGKPLLELPGGREPLLGLRQTPLRDARLLLLVSTPGRLYVFVGPETLEGLAAAYPASAGMTNFIELPAEHPCGQLATYSPPGGGPPSRFAWLAGPGLYRGSLDLAGALEGSGGELDSLAGHNLLPLPVTPGLEEHPIAVAQTEFHEVLLYPSRLQTLNRVSQALVQELPLGGAASGGLYPLGLAEDAETGSLFLFTADSLSELVISDEDRDMWRVHLDRKDWAAARRRCRTQAQRDAVAHAEASAAFEAGRLTDAARLWGSVAAPPPTFEEVALRFVEAGAPDALQAFLTARLESLPPSDKAQATMVATWLTELLLDRINRALLEDGDSQLDDSSPDDSSPAAARDESAVGGDESSGGGAPRLAALQAELRAFLAEHVGILDVRTTVGLLASYGRLDDLMHYASCRQDSEAVLEHLLQRGEAGRALALLRRPDVSSELFYRFAPGLMATAPGETVDACIAAHPPLEPGRLLPALLRFAEEGTPPAARRHALRYVTHCLDSAADEPAVHHLAVALLVSQGDEEALLGYMAAARDPLGKPRFNPEAALRLARAKGLARACVELLWELGLFEDAVALALRQQDGVSQAARLANRPQEDETLQRRLWLAIATHLVKSAAEGGQGESIGRVNELMKEAGGLVRIEDVLPLFPDFVRIDAFKDAICDSLAEYNAQIEGLVTEMDDATRIADALRRDVTRLEARAATLDLAEPCAACGRPVGEAPPVSVASRVALRGAETLNPTPAAGGALPRCLLFPTGNAFHAGCLAAEVASLAPPQQAARIGKLVEQLAKVRLPDSVSADDEARLPERARELQRQLRAEIGSEDPFNGELVIRNIDRPFVCEEEADEVASWRL